VTAPVAIITGASRGIGAGLVAGYRRAGYEVVGVARSFSSADDGEYVAVAGDIADAETARRAVDQALDRFGRIDTLINNAGIYVGKPFTRYTVADYGRRPSALPALTKGGLVAASRSLAIEYAADGIRVNAVSLGVINTPAHDPASYTELENLHPLGRVGEISDVVDAILYLERAAFVTGETLHVDGGQAAGR
jgi:NAD(P)-dependent dehydrogenase (short-subunit alcohol dehydrogenase family)